MFRPLDYWTKNMYNGHTAFQEVVFMDFYSIAEVSEMSGQSQKTIRRHIAAGKLNHPDMIRLIGLISLIVGFMMVGLILIIATE